MKRYKLKKDLPTFNEGDEFYLDSNNDLRLKGSDIMAYNHKTLEKFPNILTDWFEEITVGYERWRAERGEEYWHIDGFGKVDYGYEGEKSGDIHSDFAHFDYATGNYFKTKEEADAYSKYLLARQILIDDAEGGKAINGEKNYYANYCTLSYYNGMNWYINFDFNTYTPGVIYFRDKNTLQESLKKHKDQWEIVRKYEMGE